MNASKLELGRRIAERRRFFGLTQAKLAEKIRVQPETISRFEHGRSMPSLTKVIAIADVLNFELHDLFRVRPKSTPKDVALERLHWFATRLTAEEIEFVIDITALIIEQIRKAVTLQNNGDRASKR
jgi:transcriptional regulator with XRE-family HTH domain